MKKHILKRCFAILLVFSLLLGENAVVFAAEVETQTITETEEAMLEETVSGSDMSLKESMEVSELFWEETTEDVLVTEEEEEQQTNIEKEVVDYEDDLPGLPEEFVLSAEEMEDKQVVQEYMTEIRTMEEGTDCVEGEIIVSVESEELAQQYAKAFGGTLQEYYANVAVIRLWENADGEKITVADAVLASADSSTNLPAAWPNYYYYADDYSDPFLREDANYYNDSTWEYESAYQWQHSVVGSKAAWEAGYTGKGVKVAVLDTGNAGHEDLSAPTYTVYEDEGEDLNGHGTHVAGILGAKYQNGLGGAGIAPDAEIISIKVLGNDGRGTSFDIISGIQMAIEQDVDVINMSLSGKLYNGIYENVVTSAYEAGIALFATSGNDGVHNNKNYPAGYKGAISVAALDRNCGRANFSNYGENVRYSAPGVDIISNSNAAENEYVWKSGTSMSCPVVAGTAAVLLSTGRVEGSGAEKVDNLLAWMDESCREVKDSGLGEGCVNLEKALGLENNWDVPEAPKVSHITGTYEEECLQISLEAGVGEDIYYLLDGKKLSYTSGKVSQGAILYKEGDIIEITGKKKVTLQAISVNRNSYKASKVIKYTYTLKPLTTGIEIISATGANSVVKGKSLQLKAITTPSYAVDKSVQWAVEGNPTGISISKNGKITVKGDVTMTECTVYATAKDKNGSYNGARTEYLVKILETKNPITKITPGVKRVTVNTEEVVEVNATVVRKDKTYGSVEEIQWSSEDSKIASVFVENGVLKIIGNAPGKTKITGIATDGFGKKSTFQVNVNQLATKLEITGYTKVAAGKTITLRAMISPENVTSKDVDWKIISSDTSVSINQKGQLKAAKNAVNGNCVVQAVAKDGSGVTAQYEVEVTKGKTKSLSLSKNSVTIFRKENIFGSPTEYWVSMNSSGENTDDIKIENSNPELIEIIREYGGFRVKATGKNVGEAVITVCSADGSNLKKTCKVTVVNPGSSLLLAPSGGRCSIIAMGKKLKLDAVFETAYGEVDSKVSKLKWSSSNSNFKVDQKGNVQAKPTWYDQSAVITAKTTDGSNLIATYTVRSSGLTTKVRLNGYSSKTKVINVGAEKLYYIGWNSKYSGWRYTSQFKVNVDKPGLNAQIGTSDYYGEIVLYLYGNEPGTYKVTLSMNDGSTAKKTYKFVVK